MSNEHPHELEDAARRWADERGITTPSQGNVATLLRRARQRDSEQSSRLPLVAAVAFACVVLAVGGFALWPRLVDPALTIVVAEGDNRAPGRVVGGDGLSLATADTPITIEAGDDRIAMDHDTHVRLLKATRRGTRIALASGRVLVHVKPRANHTFEIDAGSRTVRVLGTRFSVNRPGPDTLEVAVTNGIVQVDGPGGGRIQAGETWRLSSSETTHSPLAARGQKDIDALAFSSEAKPQPLQVEPSTPPALQEESPAEEKRVGTAAPPTLAHWQSLVASGHYEEARHGLEAYVAKHNRDVEAWSLLADCRRKVGQASAVAAYRTVIALGDRAEKNRARFLAASFLQDQLHDQAAAAELLRAYLAAEAKLQPLRGSAMVRLARALCATNHAAEAQGLLRKVMQELPGTTEASQASSIIEDQSCR